MRSKGVLKNGISASDVINILNKNFQYPIVDTCIGPAIEIDSYDAFIYSAVTGAGYFDDPIYPFSPKGLLKIFYNAFDYKFVTGIFDNNTLRNTPYYLSKSKPYLFNETKYIFPIEFSRETELVHLLEEYLNVISNNRVDSKNFIIQRIEMNKKGHGMEPFMEYLACETFKQHGYVVENQIPLSHSIGSPDFGGYKTNEIAGLLIEYPFLPVGFHIIELAMLRINSNKRGCKEILIENSAIVGEAKTACVSMRTQLIKYLNTGLFDMGFELHPSKTEPDFPFTGLITLDNDLNIVLEFPKSKYSRINRALNKDDYFIWLNTYFKIYLLANLSNDELSDFYFEYQGKEINKAIELIEWLDKFDFKDLVIEITKRTKNV